MSIASRLPLSFFTRTDALQISKDLLGKTLVSQFDGLKCSGIITETEAYMAPADKASHAYNNRRTQRTEIFYAQGGVAYVYLCYGIHHLFNIITGPRETPHAILIRAIEPKEGIPIMLSRRKLDQPRPQLSAGPGVLSKAMGFNKIHTGLSIVNKESMIWVEDGSDLSDDKIVATPRIGIGYAEEYVNKPWRFYIKDSRWVSKIKRKKL